MPRSFFAACADILRWCSREAGLRFLRRRRAAFAAAVLTMSLALGANTTAFAVLKAFLLSNLRVPDADRLFVVLPERDLPGRGAVVFNEAYPNYQLLRATQHAFADVAAVWQATASWDDHGESRPLQLSRVTGSFFPTVRVFPVLGAAFTARDEGPSPAPVVVISHRLFRSAFGDDPKIIGSVMRVDGAALTVVGVMPENFEQPFPTDIWTPFDIPAPLRTAVAGARQLTVLGRVADGRTVESARQELATFTRRAIEANTIDNRDFRYQMQTIRHTLLNGADSMVLLVQAGAAVLLLLAILNVSSLLIAWGFDRRQEMAVRQALGAGSRHVMQLLLMQSVFVVGCGTVLGVVFTDLCIPWLQRLNLGQGLSLFTADMSANSTVLGVSVIVGIVAGIVAGVVPAWIARAPDLGAQMRASSRGATLSSAAIRWQKGMVFGQAALSMVVLVAATLVGVSFFNLTRVHIGFRPAQLLVAHIQLQDTQYGTHQQRAEFAATLLENLSREPALAAVGFTTTLPVGDQVWGSRFAVEQPDGSPSTEPMLLHFRRVSPAYLPTIGIPLVSGRQFDSHDDTASTGVAIVSRTLAERLWPGKSAVGKRLYRVLSGKRPPASLEVVGVVGSTLDAGFNVPAGDAVYVPYAQASVGQLSIVVAPRGSRASALAALRHALRATDPVPALNNVDDLQALVQQANALPRLESALLLAFALSALGIVGLGSYGVMSQLVVNREREFALRLVFGASPRMLGQSVLLQMLLLAVPGVAVGGLAIVLLDANLKPFVFGVNPTSAAVLSAVSAGMLLLTLIATLPSALRAMRVDVRHSTAST